MNLLLFETQAGEAFPVLEQLSTPGPAPKPGNSRWHRIRARIYHSYQALKERLDHGERLCANLRHAQNLKIVHSPALQPTEAEKKLRNFLKVSYSKHSRWLWVDALLACVGATLVWVPGPNIFFFYPAARAMSHYFAKSGASRAQMLPFSFETNDLVRTVQLGIERLDSLEGDLAELEERYNIDTLKQQLKHI
jgi:hypothetical protein